MKIACLGWGSLIWKPGVLPLQQAWRRDGPALPIDFVRQSEGGELAAVICPTAPVTPVMWTLIDTVSVACARELLRLREKIPSAQPHCIGSVPAASRDVPFSATIARWATGQHLDGVVWTALPPCFKGEIGRSPTPEEAVAYLRELPDDKREHAELYLRSAPHFIKTALRDWIEEELRWVPNSASARELPLRQGAPWPATSRRRFPALR